MVFGFRQKAKVRYGVGVSVSDQVISDLSARYIARDRENFVDETSKPIPLSVSETARLARVFHDKIEMPEEQAVSEWRKSGGRVPTVKDVGGTRAVFQLDQEYPVVFLWSAEREQWEDVEGRGVDGAYIEGWLPLPGRAEA